MNKLNIHIRLKSARKVLKLNQSEIAEDLGIQQKTISDIENGKIVNIPNSYIYYFYKKGISLEWIFDGVSEMIINTKKKNQANDSLTDNLPNDNSKNKPEIKAQSKSIIQENNQSDSTLENMYERLINSKDTTINNLESFVKMQENNMDFIKDLLLKIFNK